MRDGNGDVFVATILEGPFEWRLRPVAEGFYEREFDVVRTFSGLVGVIIRASGRLDFDAAVRYARVNDAGVYEVRAGLHVGPARLG